jgi:outer membrane biosynthesis protein TonB
MVGRRPSSVEMRTPAILSAAVHVVALVVAIANFDWFRSPLIEPEPVMVDFVKIDKHAAAPKIGVQEQQPKEAKIAEETSKAPPPKTAEPLPLPPEPPKPEVAEAKPIAPAPVEKPDPKPPQPTQDVVALKPKQPDPPKEEKKIEPPKPEPPKPEVKKVEPPKPPPPKPPPKKPDADSVVDDILKNNDKNPPIKTPQQSPQRPKEVTRQAAMAPQLSAVVTASEIEGVRSKIRPCWNPTPGARDQPVVTLTVEMNQDGTPVKAEVQDSGRYNRDQVYRSAADAAYRAVMNPRCQPWPLPTDRYNGWHTITFNFDPRDY